MAKRHTSTISPEVEELEKIRESKKSIFELKASVAQSIADGLKKAREEQEEARKAYEEAFNELIKGGIRVIDVASDEFDNIQLEYALRGSDHNWFVEQGIVNPFEEGGIYSPTIGSKKHFEGIGQDFSHARVSIADTDEDGNIGEPYIFFSREGEGVVYKGEIRNIDFEPLQPQG